MVMAERRIKFRLRGFVPKPQVIDLASQRRHASAVLVCGDAPEPVTSFGVLCLSPRPSPQQPLERTRGGGGGDELQGQLAEAHVPGGRRTALRSGVRGAAAQDAGAHGLLDVLRQHLPNLRTRTELTT